MQTTSESSNVIMIVSIVTHENYRHQGLMMKLLSRLCQDLLSEGKRLCLFYDNPEERKTYHNLEFQLLGNEKYCCKLEMIS